MFMKQILALVVALMVFLIVIIYIPGDHHGTFSYLYGFLGSFTAGLILFASNVK